MVTMLRRYNRFWTEMDDRLLLELRAAGRSSVFIAAVLKRSAHGIDKRLSTLRAEGKLIENASNTGAGLIFTPTTRCSLATFGSTRD
jgi:hypothetical protein